MRIDDAIADGPGAIVEFERGGGEKAAAGESFLFAVGEPIFAESAKEAEAAELRGGAHDFFDEDVARFVHDGALQVFFGAEVGEEAALADAQGGGELADGEALETFEGSDVDGFAEDGTAGLEAARGGAVDDLWWWRRGFVQAPDDVSVCPFRCDNNSTTVRSITSCTRGQGVVRESGLND